ncbi:unnamed protein product, partial [Brenthis ino]
MYNGFSYSHVHAKNKTRWYCSKRLTGCKARVVTTEEGEFLNAIDEVEFVTTAQGKGQLLLYQGNTFANVYKKMSWVCSKKHSGCTVQIKTTVDGKLIFCRGALEYIPINRGRGQGVLIVHKGYTFSKVYENNAEVIWYCSKRKSGCRAKLNTTTDGNLSEFVGEHNHQAPMIFRSPDGDIYKI